MPGVTNMSSREAKPLVDGQHFYSKRNQVTYHKKGDLVRKKFFDPEAFTCEVQVYQQFIGANKVHTPKILKMDPIALVITVEYIHGPLLLDCLTEAESQGNVKEALELLSHLFVWIEAAHKRLGEAMVFNDVNLRNFIYADQKLYGIDFEQVSHGNQRRELAMLLAMYLQYDPVDSEFKKTVVNQFIEARDTQWAQWMDDCKEEILNRRKGL